MCFLRMRQTIVGGIWVSRLVLRNDFCVLCKFCLRTRSTVSSDVFVCPDPFLLHKQPSSLNFLCHVQICIAVGDCFDNSLTNACCTVLLDCGRAYSNTQSAFSQSQFILISRSSKTKNIKHKILACLQTCCQNEKKFDREFA